MNKPVRVLFISAPIGAGHIRAAEAIGKAMHKLKPDVITQMANVFDFFSPYVGQTLLNTYLKILSICPQAYGMMYGWGNTNKLALAGRDMISAFLAKRMQQYILQYSPSVIVCTHATPAGLVANLIKKKKIDVPAVAVVTDFVIHRLWVYNELCHYFVATEDLRDYLARHNIEYGCSQALGIPVHDAFMAKQDKNQIGELLGLKAGTKTILLMGGGAGILPMESILKTVDTIDTPLQIIVVTGKNIRLYNKLKSLQPTLRHVTKIFGYVNNIHQLMAVSDLLISKPGGMTSSEALSMGLPMLIYRPIPGQEEANTRYLVEKKVALRADSISDLKVALRQLLQHDDNLDLLRSNALVLSRPGAAYDIADFIFSNFSH